ncbi:ATP-NAD kinase family protein [Rhodococcus sp. NPDC056960]|uniref:ATP-NAD kinase family protein n=1 Tax=Rhodococcus sp. NPDC056960 TaxID=3345982 RepID=UPI0036328320
MSTPTLGLIINPVAGMGGRVGLKGTDGADILREALSRGAQPAAQDRARLALIEITAAITGFRILTGPGEMGERAARAAGLTPHVVYELLTDRSTAVDTHVVASIMAAYPVDMILFVGGDGTARDILLAVGDRVPLVGVPAGVKMHSAVFGTNPANAGRLTGLYLSRSSHVRLREAEIIDLDEAAIRTDTMSARLYGYACSPFERHLVQNAKSGTRPGSEQDLDAAAHQLAREMQPDCLYILGPGTTTQRIARALKLPSTLLGVDAVLDGTVIGSDVDEETLLRLMSGRQARIVVGVLGGQGSLFGRGNQQISAQVIRAAGIDNLIVLSSIDKLIALGSAPLRVDTGDAQLDEMLAGHIRIRTGHDHSVVHKVA